MPGHNPRHPYRVHQRAKAAQRRREILEIYVQHQGSSYYDIGKMVGISAHHVGTLVREALAQAAQDEKDLAAVALARSIKLHALAMDAALEIVQQPCGKCNGAGLLPAEDGSKTLDDSGRIIENMEPCKMCEYGSGYAYPYQARLGALDRHQRAVEQLNKLLGLYEPGRLEVLHNFRSDLAGLPQAELDRMLDEYGRGYTDALADAQAPSQQKESA